MIRICRNFLTAFFIISLFPGTLCAQGISTDAGLTPPKGRFIVRTMMRSVQKEGMLNGINREMSTFMYPIVVVYGLRPDVTVMVRQMIIDRTLKMPTSTTASSGLGDLFINFKYKLYRKNTDSYMFGIAPTLGATLPTGKDGFSSNTFDLQAGLYSSFRKDSFGADLNIALSTMDIFGKRPNGIEMGNEISWNLAFAHQFSLDLNAHVTLAPVVEINYVHVFPNRINGQEQTNTGETVSFLSPGVKLTTPNIAFEALLQPVISQKQNGLQLERKTGIIVGIRFLF